MKNIKLKENERIDDLEYKGLKIIQNRNWFCFGIDSILLSSFAKEAKPGSKILDLGTGTGIISILLAEKVKNSEIIGIEIQKEVAEMAKRSVKMNGLENKIEIINDDIKNILKKIEKNSFDVVVTNPPYKKKQTGIINQNNVKMIARHESTANLEDFISIASKALKNLGIFYIINRPERLADIIENLRKYRLEPKQLKFVYPNIKKTPNLVMIKAVKNGKEFLKIDKPLIVYKENGEYTNEILEIYEKN